MWTAIRQRQTKTHMVLKAWFKGALTATLWSIIRIIVMLSIAALVSVRYPVSFPKLRSFPNQLYVCSAIHMLGTTTQPLRNLVIGLFINHSECGYSASEGGI